MALYREESYVKINWEEETGLVCVEWKDYAIGEELRDGMKLILQLLKEKQAQNLLLDLGMVGMIDLENQKWLANEWLPMALAYGLKNIAYLMPGSLLIRVSVKNAIEMLRNREVASNCFDNEKTARNWLFNS